MKVDTEAVVYVKSIHNDRSTIYAEPMSKMIDGIFGYTLECGHGWNSEIPRCPKTVKGLVKALNDSAFESNRYNDHYEIATKEEFEAQEEKNV